MTKTPDWTPDSWRAKPALQMPSYPDAGALAAAEETLGRMPPLVFAGEDLRLKGALAKVAKGEAFLDLGTAQFGCRKAQRPAGLGSDHAVGLEVVAGGANAAFAPIPEHDLLEDIEP